MSDVTISDTESIADGKNTAPSDIVSSSMTEVTDQSSSPVESQHPKYYFDDGTVQFLVEGHRYRLHKYLFSRDSPHWADVFANSLTFEYELAGKRSLDFDAFLSVLYSTCYCSPDMTTTHEWSAVLRLATEWSFDGIRTLAVERLEPIASPIEKIALSHSYSIAQWLPTAYTALCQRAEPLTAVEIRAVEAEDVELIMSVRETVLRGALPLDQVSAHIVSTLKNTTTDTSASDPVCPTSTATLLDEARAMASTPMAPKPVVSREEPYDTQSQPNTCVPPSSRCPDNSSDDALKESLARVEIHLNRMNSDNVRHIADEVYREITLAANGYTSFAPIVEMIHQKAVSDVTSVEQCVALCKQLSCASVPTQNNAETSRSWPWGQKTFFSDYIHKKCEAEIEDMRARKISTTLPPEGDMEGPRPDRSIPAELDVDRTTIDYIGKLCKRKIVSHSFRWQCLNRLVKDAEGTPPNAHAVELACRLFLIMCKSRDLNNSPAKHQRLSDYVSLIEGMDARQLNPRTIAMIQQLSEMKRNGWRT